jgi:hypothetical protein
MEIQVAIRTSNGWRFLTPVKMAMQDMVIVTDVHGPVIAIKVGIGLEEDGIKLENLEIPEWVDHVQMDPSCN